MEAHFGNHPLSMSVLGSAESIQQARARPDGRLLQAAATARGTWCCRSTGRLDFDEIVRLAEKYMGDWPHVDAPRQAAAIRCTSRSGITLTDPKLNRQYTMGMTPGPSAQDDRRFAARVLADVIGDSDGSRFYWALVDNAIAEDADFGFYPHDACGSFYISLTTDPERTDEALDIALKELEKVKTDLNDDEVERAKNKIASSLVLSRRSPDRPDAQRSAGSGSTTRNTARSNRTWRRCMAVTPDSLRAADAGFPVRPDDDREAGAGRGEIAAERRQKIAPGAEPGVMGHENE